MIRAKAVIRFEAVCDDCGENLGEFADKGEAAWRLTGHELSSHYGSSSETALRAAAEWTEAMRADTARGLIRR